MEANASTLSELGATLQATQLPDLATRQAAEKRLKQLERSSGFLGVALRFTSASEVPPQLRVAASILVKNIVRSHWNPSNDDATEGESTIFILCESDRVLMRTHIVGAMLEAPDAVRRQLIETLTIMAKSDFPAKWPTLLPEMISYLQSTDFSQVTGVLATANLMFKSYRFSTKSESLWLEIKYVLDLLSAPLLKSFQRVCVAIEASASCESSTEALLNVARLIAHVFLSLSSQDIPAQFEDAIKEWMPRFLAILKLPNRAISDHSDASNLSSPTEHPPQIIDRLQAVICQIASLYAEKYEEEFREFVPDFVSCVWTSLTSLGTTSTHDPVIVSSLKFLTLVISKPWHKDLFSSENRLRGICELIIVPNLRLRACDIELFEVNGLEYVRRDMEGSDQNTRRRLTCDLVRALTVHFEQEISAILFGYIDVLLKDYASNPSANWASKDAAMFIVVALAVQGHTMQQGATKVNKHVNVLEFFGSHVLPELQGADVGKNTPILCADAIKFVSTFRSLLPPDSSSIMLPLFTTLLASNEYVIHSYAAIALERLLALRHITTRVAVVSRAILQPHLGTLLTTLFQTLEHDDSRENDYVMKAIMRVCAVARQDVIPFVQVILTRLTSILSAVQQNPRNPMFNHYVFETIAVLVRSVCASQTDRAQLEAFEHLLFSPFEVMLGMESCAEFGPYVFQIMAQLLSLHEQVPPTYETMFPLLLTPAMWQQSGSVHALSQLLRVYLSRPGFAAQLAASQRFTHVLGVFQKLISSKLNDKHGITLLQSLLHQTPWTAFAPVLTQVMQLLLQRASSSMTPQFARCFAVFLADFVCYRSVDTLLDVLSKVQEGLAPNLIKQVWLPHCADITDAIDRKVVMLALAHLVTKSPTMMSGSLVDAWSEATRTLVDMLAVDNGNAKSEVKRDDVAEAMLERLQEQGGYSNIYSRLAFSMQDRNDEYSTIEVDSFFITSLSEICSAHPGEVKSRLASSLNSSQMTVIQSLLAKFNASLL